MDIAISKKETEFGGSSKDRALEEPMGQPCLVWGWAWGDGGGHSGEGNHVSKNREDSGHNNRKRSRRERKRGGIRNGHLIY